MRIRVGEVWREGSRIRMTDGTGYSDRVTDDEIRAHVEGVKLIARPGRELDFLVFAEAVLLLRDFERRGKP